jgi:hypothetical protein
LSFLAAARAAGNKKQKPRGASVLNYQRVHGTRFGQESTATMPANRNFEPNPEKIKGGRL